MPWRDPSNWVPFVMSAGASSERLNVQRIIEAIIIALVTGGVTMYGAQQMVVAKLENLDENLAKLERRQEQIFQDLYRPRVSPLERDWMRSVPAAPK